MDSPRREEGCSRPKVLGERWHGDQRSQGPRGRAGSFCEAAVHGVGAEARGYNMKCMYGVKGKHPV